MATPYYDGDYSSPVRTGLARPSAPFPSNEFCVVEEDFRQTYAGWVAGTGVVALAAAHGTLAGYYLAAVGNIRREGPFIVFTRTWVKKPTAFDTWESHAYPFIGFWGATGATLLEGREIKTETVPSKIVHEFYRVAGTTPDYASASLIPILAAQRYIWTGTNNDTEALADAPPFSHQSVPGRATYEGWMAAKTLIVAADSSVKQWLGPFYERVTRYVIAK